MSDDETMSWLDPVHGYSAVLYGRRCRARWNRDGFLGWMENVYSWAEDGTNVMIIPAGDFSVLADGGRHDVVFVFGTRASTVDAATCAAHTSWSHCYELDERGIKRMVDAGKRTMKSIAGSLDGKIKPRDPSSFETTDDAPGLYLVTGSGVREVRLMLGRALNPGEPFEPTGRVEVHAPRGPEGDHPFAYAGVVIAHASVSADPAVRVDLSARALKPLRALPELAALMGGAEAELVMVPVA